MPASPPFARRELHGFTRFLAVLALAGCTEAAQDPLGPPTFSHSGPHSVSGNVLGPDAASICNSLPAESNFRIGVVDPVNATSDAPFAGSQFLTCPADNFSISVAPGTYRLLVRFVNDPGIGALPLRFLQPGNVVIGEDVVQDIQVLNGIAMGGSATLEGSQLAGVPLNLHFEFPSPVHQAAFGTSGADGSWDDAIPARSPMTVQSDVRYLASGCEALGARVLSGLPTSGFLFPTEVAALNCALETAPGVAFSHDRTRLVVTSMPANIGGGEAGLFSQYGRGWGVQFPVDPSEGPAHTPLSASHLFNGGLLIGLEPDVVLTGMSLTGEFQCGAACRDLGPGATVKVATVSSGGKSIKWTYSDASSGDAVGLKVVQHSFDGEPPADYVLFKYTITNEGSSTRTFYAGFWGDWDVAGDALDDIGFTELDRRLMYMTNGGGGIHAGTLLLGDAPVSGSFFYDRFSTALPLSLVDQIRALKGELRRTTISAGDNRVIHAVGPITLKRKKSADVWIAIVAGESRAQLLANAEAAAAQVEQTLTQSTFQGTVSSTSLDFGETLVVQPSASVPWDGDEFVTFGGVPSSYVVSTSSSGISVVVPRLPTGPGVLWVLNQGTDQRDEPLDVAVASTFTPIGEDQITTAPDISGGPFPTSYFIELSNGDPAHFVTVAPAADLPLTVTLEWQTGVDLDIDWLSADGSALVGNTDGATLANPEQTSLTVPGGETFRLRFKQFGISAPTLAKVTITSP